METLEKLPPIIQDVHNSLRTYLKQRRETAKIRQILALHLSTCLDTENKYVVARPLSMISETSLGTGKTSSEVRGFRRDYLRSVKANVKARKEYDLAVKEQYLQTVPEVKATREGARNISHSSETQSCLSTLIAHVETKRKHDRLLIFQDYLETIARKPAAETTRFDSESLLQLESFPEIPLEVMNASGTRPASECTDLGQLVSRLEKSILRAKSNLQKEKIGLERIRRKIKSDLAAVPGDKLEALGRTRNELINWIETELGKTSETQEDDSGQIKEFKPGSNGKKDHIERHLVSIQKQYSQYAKAREALIHSATGRLASSSSTEMRSSKEALEDKFEMGYTKTISSITFPYIEELAVILNEQKSILQQRSHLTTSLAKQLKESNQGLDLLAEESHLLPAHPLPADWTASKSFADEILNMEKPDSSRKAREWGFASGSASVATRIVVSGKLKEGELAISDSQKALIAVQELLGVGNDNHSATDVVKYTNIWELLDGQLGAIKGDD